MRAALMGSLLALALAGCSATVPLAPAPFETKLLNTISSGSQSGSQTNLIPNNQLNYASQYANLTASAVAPVASAIGAALAEVTNLTSQNLINLVSQTQNQQQLVL